MSTPELRKKWRAHHDECDRSNEEHEKIQLKIDEWNKRHPLNLMHYPTINYPPFPDELRGMTWGAKTRAGTPCKLKSIYRSGRCKLHGGFSTGPKTLEGKKRSAMNGFKPKSKWTPWDVGKSILLERNTKSMKTWQNLTFWMQRRW